MSKKGFKNKRDIRHRRVRARISGTMLRPRLYVFKSNQHIYAGIVDDTKGATLVAFSDNSLKDVQLNKTLRAQKVGEELGKAAQAAGIKRVVFDRGGYKYHGRVKALAEGARATGLTF